MSKRSRQRKARQIAAAKAAERREQVALREDAVFGEETEQTIGQRVRQLYDSKKLPVLNGEDTSLEALVAAPIKQMPMPQITPTLQAAPWPKDWPECPTNCDLMEWRRAQENRDHYLLCKMNDSENKPWFQFPRFPYQYSEFVHITPDMAEELLKFNPVNRKVKSSWVEALRRDILNHRWLQTHESIAINKLGNMHDGQHRAHAVIKAGVGWPIYCTWNVPPEAIYATDSGDKRPVNEKLGFLFPDLRMTHKTAALCRSMMAGLANRGTRYTETEIAGFMIQHKLVLEWLTSNLHNYRADLQAVVGKALLWWGEPVIGPFVERLRTVLFTSEGDPARSLYHWIQNAKQKGRKDSYANPVTYYKKTLAAIHAHAAGKEAKRIIAKEQDIFEWLSGWKVPENAPCAGKVFKE